jgi:hypothetical protein
MSSQPFPQDHQAGTPVQPSELLNWDAAVNRLNNIPNALKATTNFVGWRRETVEGDVTKVPYNLITGRKAASNNPATWVDFKTAVAALAVNPANAECDATRGYNGIGIVLAGIQKDSKPVIGLDFDDVINHAVDGDALNPYVASILSIANPYCEITPSRNGVRAFVFADGLPKNEEGKATGGRKFKAKNDAAEIYAADEPGRYDEQRVGRRTHPINHGNTKENPKGIPRTSQIGSRSEVRLQRLCLREHPHKRHYFMPGVRSYF